MGMRANFVTGGLALLAVTVGVGYEIKDVQDQFDELNDQAQAAAISTLVHYGCPTKGVKGAEVIGKIKNLVWNETVDLRAKAVPDGKGGAIVDIDNYRSSTESRKSIIVPGVCKAG